MFVLDTNVFIAAHRDYYDPNFCRGFWECLEHYARTGRLQSIDQVRREITSPPALVKWTKPLASKLFRSTTQQGTIDAFKRMQKWVSQNEQFKDAAKNEFAQVADGWLVAYAKANNFIVVTLEAFNPNVKRRVPIPNVCEEFGVEFLNTYEMLRRLGVSFSLDRRN